MKSRQISKGSFGEVKGRIVLLFCALIQMDCCWKLDNRGRMRAEFNAPSFGVQS